LQDIGTKGEVALGSRSGILATLTVAGPAFEDAQILHGMAGIIGAINTVYVKVTTIGNTAQKGICGSGIIDAMAVILDIGLAD
jgi:uncharacterized 2Fe-2S/4Fe-4S cluster protein (DUF4445 family)